MRARGGGGGKAWACRWQSSSRSSTSGRELNYIHGLNKVHGEGVGRAGGGRSCIGVGAEAQDSANEHYLLRTGQSGLPPSEEMGCVPPE